MMHVHRCHPSPSQTIRRPVLIPVRIANYSGGLFGVELKDKTVCKVCSKFLDTKGRSGESYACSRMRDDGSALRFTFSPFSFLRNTLGNRTTHERRPYATLPCADGDKPNYSNLVCACCNNAMVSGSHTICLNSCCMEIHAHHCVGNPSARVGALSGGDRSPMSRCNFMSLSNPIGSLANVFMHNAVAAAFTNADPACRLTDTDSSGEQALLPPAGPYKDLTFAVDHTITTLHLKGESTLSKDEAIQSEQSAHVRQCVGTHGALSIRLT